MRNNRNEKLQNNSIMNRIHKPRFTSLRPCPLDQCCSW